jgi:hypothetical protein
MGCEMSAKTTTKATAEPLPDWLPLEAWAEYLAMRKKVKKPMTEYAQKLALRKLLEFKDQGQSVEAVLEQSIFHSWQGLFAVHPDPQLMARVGRPAGPALEDLQRANNEAAKRKLFGDSADWVIVDEGVSDAP